MPIKSYHDALNNIIFQRPAIIPGLAFAGAGYFSGKDKKTKIRNAILGGLVGGIAPNFFDPKSMSNYTLGGGTIGAGLGYYLGDDKLFSTLVGGLAGTGIGNVIDYTKNIPKDINNYNKSYLQNINNAEYNKKIYFDYNKDREDFTEFVSSYQDYPSNYLDKKYRSLFYEKYRNLSYEKEENPEVQLRMDAIKYVKEDRKAKENREKLMPSEDEFLSNDWKEFKKRLTTPKHLGNIGIGLAGGGAIGAGLGYLSGDTKEDKKNKALIGAMIGGTIGGVGGYLY